MSANTQRQTNRLYQQDIVQRASHPFNIGIILRSWHDAEDVHPAAATVDPVMRPLNSGEVGVSFIGETGGREVLQESELRLVDRTLQPGDICKRSIDDVRSGVVTKVRVKARLEHAVSGEHVDGWWTSDEVEHSGDPDIGEYVITDDWLGQIMETYDESLVEATSGQVVRLPEMSSRLFVGEKGNDIFPTSTSSSRLMNFLRGNRMEGVDTVVSVKHTVYAIAWLAINQSLDPREAENKSRPPRFWHGSDIAKLTVIRGRPDLEMRVGDQMKFKDSTTQGHPVTRHGREGDSNGVVTVQTYFVAETRTSLEVLWQDGVRETLPSTDIIPYYNPDEYDCWPGDQVIWKSEDQSRAAIVQTVNAEERTAKILFGDTSKVELVSVLELDPHGTPDAASDPQAMPDGLGVYRGDVVFIHKPGTTNGYTMPRVPRIGELEPWVREVQGQMRGWRKEMADIGDNLANENPKTFDVCMAHPGSGEFHWVGEVTDLKLDGMVEVTHPDWSVAIYPLERLTKLYDGIEQLEDDPIGDGPHEHDSLQQDEVWAYNDEGIWEQIPDGEGDWEDEGDEEAEGPMEVVDAESNGWGSDIDDDIMSEDSVVGPGRGTTIPPLVKVDFPPLRRESSTSDEAPSESRPVSWKRFDILSSTPPDHAFYGTETITPPRAFVSRLAKEYRVLTTSLPDSIVVRAYEDRVDLLRTLIIGPENTPYQDAPFVIDWQLDSSFPQSPPIAHFWSWTNGNGRVNPNLYEEGKVCLSILGTWAGDKNETWNPARSSLLQALVSIQGLVLVKEPWFCEPAYEKLRGTEEGSVNSRLYNEKAYILSRGFVRRALEVPMGGLESEIRWIYYDDHKLERIVAEAEALIETSRGSTGQSASNTELAVPRLTVGGIITLERTLKKLRGILDQILESR